MPGAIAVAALVAACAPALAAASPVRMRNHADVMSPLSLPGSLASGIAARSSIVPDTTPPTITVLTPTEGQHFAFGSSVTTSYSCADEAGGSGVATCMVTEAVTTAAAGAHTFKASATDMAGNAATKTVNYVVDPDATAPTITVTAPAEGQHFALGSAVASDYACSDGTGSGIATCVVTEDVSTATSGAHTFTVSATDVAGNPATKTVNYVVDPDTTDPTITVTTPTEGQHFARLAPVTSSYSCADAGGSLVASCHATQDVSTATAGAHVFTVVATDGAGNSTTRNINYVVDQAADTTPPVITITSPTEGQHVALNSVLIAEFSCLDALGGSGANSCTSNAVDTSTVGGHDFVVATSDNAGNTTTKTVNYIVDPDTALPVITITTPTEGQHFALGAAVAGAFSCNGTGTAVSTCSESGPLDTSTAGLHAYTVTASDAAGNAASKTVNYVVDPAAGGGTGGGGTGGGSGAGGTGSATGATGTGATGTDSSAGAGAASGPLARFSLGPLPASFTPSAAGAIRLLVRCTAAVTCRGTVKITVPRSARSKATIVIASARYAVAAKKSVRIVIKLNPIGRKRVRLSRTALRATLTVTPSDRRIKAVKRSITLKRARR